MPPYEQVRAQLAAGIESVRLQPSVRLPTVRKVAADLGLAVNTVAKAYRQLELGGLVETRAGRVPLWPGELCEEGVGDTGSSSVHEESA